MSRTWSDSEYSTTAPHAGEFRLYDFQRMGRYAVYGTTDAWVDTDGDGFEDYVTYDVPPTYVTAKRAGRAHLSATRQGRYVRLSATAKRYDGSYPTWVSNRGDQPVPGSTPQDRVVAFRRLFEPA